MKVYRAVYTVYSYYVDLALGLDGYRLVLFSRYRDKAKLRT